LKNIEQVGVPIVKAAFKGKDGNVYVGVMMVDTYFVHCILNKSILSLIWNNLVNFAKETYQEKAALFLNYVLTTTFTESCRDVPIDPRHRN